MIVYMSDFGIIYLVIRDSISLVGSVLVILAPLRNLFKVQKFRIILPVFHFIALYTVITGMTGQ
jgi:hypothetical protein